MTFLKTHSELEANRGEKHRYSHSTFQASTILPSHKLQTDSQEFQFGVRVTSQIPRIYSTTAVSSALQPTQSYPNWGIILRIKLAHSYHNLASFCPFELVSQAVTGQLCYTWKMLSQWSSELGVQKKHFLTSSFQESLVFLGLLENSEPPIFKSWGL